MIKEENYKIKEGYDKEILSDVLKNFDTTGSFVVQGARNQIKKFVIINNGKEKEINIKRFGRKNILTELIYKFFRASKAKRSYEFGNRLLQKNRRKKKFLYK